MKNRNRLMAGMAIIVAMAATLCAQVASGEVVGYWTFDDDVLDHSGFGNDGTAIGSPAFDSDFATPLGGGKSMSFDGIDDIISIAHAAQMPISSHAEFAVSMWVKGADGMDERRIFAEGSTLSGTPIFDLETGTVTAVDNDRLSLYYRSTAGSTRANHLSSDQVAFDESWHHVLYVDNRGSVDVYIDGILDGNSFDYAPAGVMANQTSIGGLLRAAASHWFTGNIDDVAIFNTALDASAATALAAGTAPTALAEPVKTYDYKIDIDTSRTSGTGVAGVFATEPGWTSLDVTFDPTLGNTGNGASVTIEGVQFSVASADSSRIRSTGTSLTADFAFDDGDGAAIILRFGDAGDLPAGTWEVELYSHDGLTSLTEGLQIVGYRENGVETLVADDVGWDPENSVIMFQFVSDGVSAYDVFLRENDEINRTRLNGATLRLVPIPEPSSMALAMLAMFSLVSLARRRRPTTA